MAVSDESAAGKPKTDWLAVRKQYETGSIGQRKLARLLGLSESTIMKRAMREKWRQNAKTVKKAVDELEAEIEDRVQTRLKDDLAPWIEKNRVRFTKRGFKVASRGFTRVEKLLKSDASPDAKEEAYISKAAETYHRIGRVALGMGDGSSIAGPINLNILANQAAIQVSSQN